MNDAEQNQGGAQNKPLKKNSKNVNFLYMVKGMDFDFANLTEKVENIQSVCNIWPSN